MGRGGKEDRKGGGEVFDWTMGGREGERSERRERERERGEG